MEKQQKVSFCITCKGRLHHLKQTLPQNLRNASDYPNAEFVVLDYDSKDGLEEWIKKHFQNEINSGRIRYAKLENKPHFHMAHAKNVAHRVATGAILCNLDADNTITPDFPDWLNKQFSDNKNVYTRPHRKELLRKRLMLQGDQRGIRGRIAIHRDHFFDLRGYDENLKGYGDDDGNFDARANLAGLTRIDIPYKMLGGVILHSDDERIQHVSPEAHQESKEFLDFKASLRGKIERLQNLKGRQENTPTPANTDGNFGCGTVLINFKDELELAPITGETAPEVSSPATEISRESGYFTGLVSDQPKPRART